MSTASTIRMIAAYMEQASAPLFLSGFFQTPPQNIHDSEFVEIDVQRDDPSVAIVLEDLTVGARQNSNALWTNKQFAPPIFDEEGTINSFDLIKRMPGQDPFQSPDFQANLVTRAFQISRKLENKVRRAIELMCAQLLTTGKLILTDATGLALYTLDFQLKATHFPTAAVAWAADGLTGDPLGDLGALAQVIRTDGLKVPNTLIFGRIAAQRFLANAAVQKRFPGINGLGIGGLGTIQIQPDARGEGASKMGTIVIDNYVFNMWSYNGVFKNPIPPNAITPYVPDDKVIMLSDTARLDLSFGSIPRVVPPDPRVSQFLPPRMSDGPAGLDLSLFAWVTADGKHLKMSAGTRPLAIPTAADTFGALDIIP